MNERITKEALEERNNCILLLEWMANEHMEIAKQYFAIKPEDELYNRLERQERYAYGILQRAIDLIRGIDA